jgi:pilus assembly protein Flp/PilA
MFINLFLWAANYKTPTENKLFTTNGRVNSMNKFKILMRAISDNSGATAIEYALIASLIAISSIAALNAVGASVSDSFQSTADALDQ